MQNFIRLALKFFSLFSGCDHQHVIGVDQIFDSVYCNLEHRTAINDAKHLFCIAFSGPWPQTRSASACHDDRVISILILFRKKISSHFVFLLK